ncbi:lycopene cyclase domain-containing protein [Nocardioides houyundeii]|uniref:lycopene cyclase domain-containing protein n=1 Tax=Nocardioides houyundeii TaxID=2045452 RepID=UPI000C7692F4|nr:lycopene cyclase domain-containing protein [Nocardioides houyundeii]
MSLLYLGFVVLSTLCMGLVDRRWSLFLFARPRLAAVVVGLGVAFFIAWDLVAIELGMYVRGDSPAMTGLEVLPELPVEEIFFIIFLCYITMVLHSLLLRAPWRAEVRR